MNTTLATKEELLALYDTEAQRAKQANIRRHQQDLDPSDCALSWFADSKLNELARWKYTLIRNDRYWRFPVLFRVDGTPVQYREFTNKFRVRTVGVLGGEDNRYTDFLQTIFYYDTDRKKANLLKKGYRWEWRLRKAWATLSGKSLVSVGVRVFPTHDDWPGLEMPEWFNSDDRDFTGPEGVEDIAIEILDRREA